VGVLLATTEVDLELVEAAEKKRRRGMH
jgi:hypothetical protein